MELSFLSIITLWCHAKLVNWFNRMYMWVCACFYEGKITYREKMLDNIACFIHFSLTFKYKNTAFWNTITSPASNPYPAHPALYCSIPASIAHCSHHDLLPLVAVCNRNRASAVGLLPSNWCTSSQLPLCETGESGEDGPAMCWSRRVRGGVITYCLSPSKTYEGDLCLPYCEGMLTARQRVADGEMQPIFSPQPERLLKV